MTIFAFVSSAAFKNATDNICITNQVYNAYQMLLTNPNLNIPSDMSSNYDITQFCGGR
jgi:hypothetical protein